MTVITVNMVRGRFDQTQRRELARTLTDAVLVPEVGQLAPAARAGFQVHFCERDPDMMAIGGIVLADQDQDALVVDIAVMDGDWRQEVRTQVIERILAALTAAAGSTAPAPTWWVNFRVIEEGSWGSRGGVLSILDLLPSGVFTAEKAAAIQAAIGSPAR
ncbi:4-oxalocrotonate tautomerase family protein [Nocardia sp. GCM10030253]|uniref:tautomerase family protein n=1 Tax=Nocardia sp. GCM10030253 TaxID=3273404 RepID=UPI003625FD90